MPRRRRLLSAADFAAYLAVVATVAVLALAPAKVAAQTLPDSSIDLLAPSLDGNPRTPPRFRRPGQPVPQAPAPGKFTAPSRIGATPVYGSPTGFGAGDTGFDSKNRSHSKRLARAPAKDAAGAATSETTFAPLLTPAPEPPKKPPARPPKPPPDVHPAKAAARQGVTLPPPPDPAPVSNPPAEVHPLAAANRPGAVVPIPPPAAFAASAETPPPGLPPPNTLPLGAPGQRLLPLAGVDPYAPVGVRAGSFLLFPAVEFSAAYDTNPTHLPGGTGSDYFVVAPELRVQSDWSRHSLTANISGSYFEYGENYTPSLNRPFLNSKIDGQIDVTHETKILLENRLIVATDNPGSPNIQAGLAKLPIYTTVGGTLGVDQQLDRFDLTLKGTIDRSVYNNSVLTDGEVTTNEDRNFNQYGGIARLGYELNPGFKPFVEVDADTRVHDLQFDRSDLQRNSEGTSGKAGATIDVFGSLTGEFALGYLERTYKDPTLPNISGPIADGALLWQATALTSAKLSATSTVTESVLPGVSGAFSRDFALQVDHAFRRWLIGTAKLGYGRDEYVGIGRDDNRYFVSAGIAYKMNQSMQLRTELRHDWLNSNVTGVAYDSTSMLLGLRLQR